MGRKCDLTGKKKQTMLSPFPTLTVVQSVYRKPNLQTKRVWWPQGKRWVKLRLSTKAIKTLHHKGIDAMAKEAGIDLSKY